MRASGSEAHFVAGEFARTFGRLAVTVLAALGGIDAVESHRFLDAVDDRAQGVAIDDADDRRALQRRRIGAEHRLGGRRAGGVWRLAPDGNRRGNRRRLRRGRTPRRPPSAGQRGARSEQQRRREHQSDPSHRRMLARRELHMTGPASRCRRHRQRAGRRDRRGRRRLPAGAGAGAGSMTLIDAARAEELYAAMPPAIESSGGSAGNTIASVAVARRARGLHRQGRRRPARPRVPPRHESCRRLVRRARHRPAARRPDAASSSSPPTRSAR